MTLLKVHGIYKNYSLSRASGLFGRIGATVSQPVLHNVDLEIEEGESVGLVGRSGSGKSTLALVLARLLDADSGMIHFDGQDIGTVKARRAASAAWRGEIQLVFQDVRGSLNPLAPCGAAIAAPLTGATSRQRMRETVEHLARQVHLPLHLLDTLPHRLSGGEAARVNIARALASAPRLLILDEPTASLDLPVQAAIMQTLDALRRDRRMAILLISHDRDVVRLMCERVLHMQDGRLSALTQP